MSRMYPSAHPLNRMYLAKYADFRLHDAKRKGGI